MWLRRFWNRQVENLNNIILSQFCQAAIICETGPSSSRHVAVPVPEPAGRNLKYYSSGILRITLFMMFKYSSLSINFVIFIQAAVIFETGPGSCRHVAVPVLEPAGRIFK